LSPPSTVRTSIGRSASVTGFATLTSRVLGLARDQVLAALFGAGNEMDAFIVAFRIPNLVRDLFAEGAMSAAFVPTFTRHVTLRGKDDAWRLGNNVINALILATVALVAFGLAFSRPLVTLYASEYAQVPGKLELTIQLTRVVLPFLTLTAVAAALMGMLNSLHHYFVPALAPATFNVATILCALALVPLMPRAGLPPIMAIAIGAIIGGLAQVAAQWRPLWREGFRYRPLLDWSDPGLRRVLLLMGPGTIGLAATQVNLFVNTLLATGEGTGAASWLTYAFRLMYLPIGLFGVSIATVVLPAAARHAALEDEPAIRSTLARGLGLMLVLNVPASFGLLALATPIVRVLFERGRFLPSDTAATAAALQLYAIGLVGYSAARIASPVYYALGRNTAPVVLSIASIAVNIVASVVLVRYLGFRGLALATSIAALVHGLTLLALLRRLLHGIEGGHLAVTLGKTFVASAVMAAAAAATEKWLIAISTSGVQESNAVAQAGSLFAAICAGLVVLAITARLLRIREFDEALALVRRRA
jgi:putative peptidoglycan lipid II flippase